MYEMALHSGIDPDRPRVVHALRVSVTANEPMEFRSPVVLDESFSVGRAFGACGTPSAVLIDEDGKIAFPLAVGTPAILTLARSQMGSPHHQTP
jgi:hypothetical protein